MGDSFSIREIIKEEQHKDTRDIRKNPLMVLILPYDPISWRSVIAIEYIKRW